MCNFKVGQKVVCINDNLKQFDIPGMVYIDSLDGLRKGVIYTIRSVYIESYGPHEGEVSVRLEEIIRPSAYGNEVGYNPLRFKPLVEKKTDISIFQSMLKRDLSVNKLNLKVLEEQKEEA